MSATMAGAKFRAPNNLIAQLESAETNRAGKKFAAERYLDWQLTGTGDRVSGKLVDKAQPASGRFAMITTAWYSSLSRGATRSPST